MSDPRQHPTNVRPLRPIADRPSPQSTKARKEGKIDRGTESNGSLGFFAVDHRAFRRACGLGVNQAIAYLIMARGTLKDNRTTSWSVQAIEKYTTISRNRAKAAIQSLTENGLVQQVNTSEKHPRRRLVEAHCIAPDHLPPMTEAEKALFDRLPIYTRPKLPKTYIETYHSLRDKGYARLHGTRIEVVPEVLLSPDPRPDWVWMPNSLVDGLNGSTSPVELLRQTQDIRIIRLLVDLYHVHSLSFDGGVNQAILCQEYECHEVCGDNNFVGWTVEAYSDPIDSFFVNKDAGFYAAFIADSPAEGEKDFWAAIETLQKLGLLSFALHMFESDDPEAEIICPVVEPRPGRDVTEAEGILFAAMSRAGQKLWESCKQRPSNQMVVPVARHIKEAIGKGIVRLRHRPHTAVTADWLSRSDRWYKEAAFWNDYCAGTTAVAA